MLNKIYRDIQDAGGRSFIVGGAVRDELLGIDPKDLDIEVFGLSPERLTEILELHGNVDTVGVSFGVLKLRCSAGTFDFTLPRRENKEGRGHKGFVVTPDPFMSLAEAAYRRDFTINSMMKDALTGEIFDCFGGRADLHNKMLIAVGNRFSDDPLRVLRGFQLAGRFDMKTTEGTASMCRELLPEYSELSLDRVWNEWKKWGLKSTVPSAGLKFLEKTGWDTLYPEISNMKGVLQNPQFHPEGDVSTHVAMVCNEAALIAEREKLNEEDRLILMFSALAHDFGKVTHSQGVYPRITSRGHDVAGVPLAESFLYRIGSPNWLIPHVKSLVRCHMRHLGCGTPKAVKKIAVDVEPSNLTMLSYLIEADHSGRSPLPKGLPSKALRMLELSKQEGVSKCRQTALIKGQHLLDLGETAGPFFGFVVKKAYQEQIAGVFKDVGSARRWLTDNLDELKKEWKHEKVLDVLGMDI